jgi:hypothetical protein
MIGAVRARSLASAILDLYRAALRADAVARTDFLDDQDDDTGQDEIERLVQERWDDVVEISERLRAYVRAHRDAFERAHEEGRAKTRRALDAVELGRPAHMSDAEWRAIVMVRR